MKQRCHRIVSLLCLAVLASSGFAQSDLGSIVGFVKDPSGATVPKAMVTVKSEATGTARRTTTNEAGYYVVTNVPPGFYSVSVEAPGFKNSEVTHNKLDSNATATVDAAMAVGAPAETVEVSAAVTTLQSESAAIQGLVTREQIDMLELNGRNPIGLAGLVPGARGNTMANLTFNFS